MQTETDITLIQERNRKGMSPAMVALLDKGNYKYSRVLHYTATDQAYLKFNAVEGAEFWKQYKLNTKPTEYKCLSGMYAEVIHIDKVGDESFVLVGFK